MKNAARKFTASLLKSLIFVVLILLINSPIINNYLVNFNVFALNPNNEITVLGGGFPVGLEISSNGVLVVGKCEVMSAAGKVIPKSDLLKGDIIKKVNGKEVKKIGDISSSLVGAVADSKIIILVNRYGVDLEIEAYPIREEFSNELKLGIYVRDSISGVGTMTFIKENGEFACLGHPICDQDTQVLMPCLEGALYKCDIIGYDKGQRGKPGGLKGQIVGKSVGKITENCKYGVYGRLENLKALNNGSLKAYKIGSRNQIQIGKASILTTIDNEMREYSLEIVRCFNQNTRNDKSMVIKVTDPILLEKTGGIIQGMSGSPIIQNGKIVGAVTHVFVNDPTKGYGIYADWML